MFGLHPYLTQHWTVDPNPDPDHQIDQRLQRAMAKSECEICKSIRYTDFEHGMEVCRACQLVYLPGEGQ